jgi:hypothetical protein
MEQLKPLPKILVLTSKKLFFEALDSLLPAYALQPAASAEQLLALAEQGAEGILLLPETAEDAVALAETLPDLPLPALLLAPAKTPLPPSSSLLLRPVRPETLRRQLAHILAKSHIWQWGNGLRYDPVEARIESPEGGEFLTEKENALLKALVEAAQSVPRETLLRDIWRYDAQADTHTLETHLYRLRSKLEAVFGRAIRIESQPDGLLLVAA